MLASPLRAPLIRTGKYGNRPPIPKPGGGFTDPNHRGVDIRAAIGTPFYPVEAGTVVQTRQGARTSGERIFTDAGAGNLVVVRGNTGDIVYSHLQSVAVTLGQKVGTGTLAGRTGASGVTAAHLHVGIWKRTNVGGKWVWTPIDPTPLLPWDGDKFGELTIETKDDDMNDADRKWMQETLNFAERRIKADTAVKVEAAVSAIAAVGDALSKIGAGGLSGEDRTWMQSVLNAAEKRIKDADQMVNADEIADALIARGLPSEIVLEIVAQTKG